MIGSPKFSFDTDDSIFTKRNNITYKLCLKLLHQPFKGIVNLSNDLTHYEEYVVDTNIVLTLGSYPEIAGCAIIRMKADGSHTPDFTAFTKLSSSQDWDTTLNAINLVSFSYDGTIAWYCIDQVSA